MEERLIGQYRVTGILGEGGMGVVYAAEHTLLSRPAAVKVLLPRFSSEQVVVQRFFNEARATTAIQHPGIVEIYDFGWTSDGAAFIVMEYLRGETLRARRQRGPLRWSTSLALVRQIAGALGAAHAKGIVHRDLKPDNVFLVPDPEVPGGERIKLLDFGIAKLAGDVSSRDKTQTGALMGTPTYMAPEQCRGVAVDARADLYSLGCILFELCTGRPPFVGEGAGDVLAAHIYLPPPSIASLVSGAPREIEGLIRQMLAKSPADRVQTADELIRLIDAAKAAIRQATRTDPRPVATPSISWPGVAASGDQTEPEDENVPTERKHPLPQHIRTNAAEPALVSEVQKAAAIPAIPASQLGTTLSSVAGIRSRGGTRGPARSSAVLGGVGGLVTLGAIAASFALFRGGKDGDPQSPSASSSPSTEPAASAATPPAPTVTPLAPTVTPLETEAAPPAATPPRSIEPTASPSPLAPTKSTQSNASASVASPLPARTDAPQASVRSSPSPSPSPSPATEIMLSIQSIPPGAVISRGNDVWGVTPQDVPLARGDYEIKLELRLSGYQTHELAIRPIGMLQKTVVLKRLPPPQALPSSKAESSARPPSSPPSKQSSPKVPPAPPQQAPKLQGINPF